MARRESLPREARTLAEGSWLRLCDRGGFEYCERVGSHGVVVIAAVTRNGRLLLVEQYRPAVDACVIEPPAGLIDPGEAPRESAARELFEETGYRAGSLEARAAAPASPGMLGEIFHFFVASDLERDGPGGGDATEQITVHEVALGEVEGWLTRARAAGKLVDLKTLAALYLLGRNAFR